MRLSRDFFEQNTIDVAQNLLGKRLIFNHFQGLVTETEAYTQDDPACHAFKGKTPRNAVLYNKAGYSYVYFIYGMYYCLNVVTEQEGRAAAVLLRGLLIEDLHLNGPGKLCKHLGIIKAHHNEIDMIESPTFYFEETNINPSFVATPRIGIKVGTDLLWRFVIKDPKSLWQAK